MLWKKGESLRDSDTHFNSSHTDSACALLCMVSPNDGRDLAMG